MNMYDQFGVDQNLETSGIWIDYDSFRVLVARAGGSNKKYMSYAELKTKPFRRALQAGTMTNERSQALLYDIYAKTVILDWETADGVDEKDGLTKWKKGIQDREGNILPVTPENLIATFKALPDLFTDLQQAAESMSLFRKEEVEADAKNSSKS